MHYYRAVAAVDLEASSRSHGSTTCLPRLAPGVGVVTFTNDVLEALRDLRPDASASTTYGITTTVCATRHSGPRLEVVSLSPVLGALIEGVAREAPFERLIQSAGCALTRGSRAAPSPRTAFAGWPWRSWWSSRTKAQASRSSQGLPPAPGLTPAIDQAGLLVAAGHEANESMHRQVAELQQQLQQRPRSILPVCELSARLLDRFAGAVFSSLG